MDFFPHEEQFFPHSFLSIYFTFPTYLVYFQLAALYYTKILFYYPVLCLVDLIYHQSDSSIFFVFLEGLPFDAISIDEAIFLISSILEIFYFL